MWDIKETFRRRLLSIGVSLINVFKSVAFKPKETGDALFLLMRKLKNKYKYLHVYRLFQGVSAVSASLFVSKPTSHKVLKHAASKNSGVPLASPFAYWCDVPHPSHISHYIKKTGDSIAFNQVRV